MISLGVKTFNCRYILYLKFTANISNMTYTIAVQLVQIHNSGKEPDNAFALSGSLPFICFMLISQGV